MKKESEITTKCDPNPIQNSCFDLLTSSEKNLVENNSVTVVYKKGEIICKQGAFASHIIFLQSGLVKQYLEGNPRNLILTITPSGNMIGLPAIYEGNITFPYSVATYVNCSVELIDISVFKQILSQNAKFAFRILSILNENTAQTYGRFFCISQKQLHGRLADILLCLARRVFGNNSFELPLSRNDLAELTGMSTESVIRIMKDFKDDGLISSCGKSFEILDFARLYKISEVG